MFTQIPQNIFEKLGEFEENFERKKNYYSSRGIWFYSHGGELIIFFP